MLANRPYTNTSFARKNSDVDASHLISMRRLRGSVSTRGINAKFTLILPIVNNYYFKIIYLQIFDELKPGNYPTRADPRRLAWSCRCVNLYKHKIPNNQSMYLCTKAITV